MPKQVRCYAGDPRDGLCPNLKAITRKSRNHWNTECALTRKPQGCYDAGICTMLKKVRG